MDNLVGKLSLYFYANENESYIRKVLLNEVDTKAVYSGDPDEIGIMKFLDCEDHLQANCIMKLGVLTKVRVLKIIN